MNTSTTKVASWNWAAALFPAGWFLYRKMYKAFVLVFLLSLLFALPGLYMAGTAAQFQDILLFCTRMKWKRDR